MTIRKRIGETEGKGKEKENKVEGWRKRKEIKKIGGS